MSNILERLRAMENDLYYSEAERCLARNAADEIEHLRAQLMAKDIRTQKLVAKGAQRPAAVLMRDMLKAADK